ncbi:Uma2 family endonuclease [Thermus thermophilus]|uniref:Uma2 family endonuclease n=1 Tax=Thermus thermophilus TaxID=274 RepID=UPI0003A77019|nr:Uma2 family endonuclease [Thermus thermophilus]
MVKTRLTAEEFFALPLERGELVDGEVREERPPRPEHGRIAGEVFFRIRLWLEETKLGMAGVEGGFVLRRDPDRVRSPDVWFLSHERLKEVAREGFYEGAPDLAVEVVSPGEEAEGVLAKVLDYLEAGAKAVWLVYPELKAVEVYGRGGEGRLLRSHEVLEGGEALPGFRLPLEALFGQ